VELLGDAGLLDQLRSPRALLGTFVRDP
jgi:hypothetical protein